MLRSLAAGRRIIFRTRIVYNAMSQTVQERAAVSLVKFMDLTVVCFCHALLASFVVVYAKRYLIPQYTEKQMQTHSTWKLLGDVFVEIAGIIVVLYFIRNVLENVSLFNAVKIGKTTYLRTKNPDFYRDSILFLSLYMLTDDSLLVRLKVLHERVLRTVTHARI